MKISGAVLAGGMSRRMGTNKAFIKIGKETMIERALRVLSPCFDELFIVANDILLFEDLSVRVYSDIYKGAGSLGGVFTALFHSNAERCFVTACDMPLLDRTAVELVLENSADARAAAPYLSNRFHPMHAVYSKECMKPAEEMIKAGELRITDLLDRVETKRLGPEIFTTPELLSSVENINTREELERLYGKKTE